MNNDPYRPGDAAYKAVGEYEGLKQLTDQFYQIMASCPEFKMIRDLHHEDLGLASEKLALFFCGYFNGPNLYAEKFGSFRLAAFHQHIPIGSAERDSWLECMQQAINQQAWDSILKEHVIRRLHTPAERCRSRP